MDQIRRTALDRYSRLKSIDKEKEIIRKIRITFYRTKPGCYSPAPYRLKFRKLSEVLK